MALEVYGVQYKEKGGEWQSAPDAIDVQYALITGLSHDKDYEFRVCSKTNPNEIHHVHFQYVLPKRSALLQWSAITRGSSWSKPAVPTGG